MPTLNETIRTAWENREGPVVFTTVDVEGTPNAIYVTCVNQYGDDTLLIADNFFNKTRANIMAGSTGSLLFITKEGKSFQIKGKLTYHSQGAVFEDMKKWNPARLPGHAVAALNVEHIFSGAEKLA